MVRTVFGLGTLAACLLAYRLSGVNTLEAILLPGILMGLVVFGAFLFSRARRRQEWSKAWETYAEREVRRTPFVDLPAETFSAVAAN